MPERYEVRVDGETITPEFIDAPAFDDVRIAIIEAEWEVARRENRDPSALQWVPTAYGWASTGQGRAQIVRIAA
jgi:hypothetical protein